MTTREIMRERAAEMLDDAFEKYGLIEAHDPDREPTARLMLSDAQRAHFLIMSKGRLSQAALLEIVSRLKRADLIARALGQPVQ
jgi:hypothetical protein